MQTFRQVQSRNRLLDGEVWWWRGGCREQFRREKIFIVVKALNKIMKMNIFGLFDAFIVQHLYTCNLFIALLKWKITKLNSLWPSMYYRYERGLTGGSSHAEHILIHTVLKARILLVCKETHLIIYCTPVSSHEFIHQLSQGCITVLWYSRHPSALFFSLSGNPKVFLDLS